MNMPASEEPAGYDLYDAGLALQLAAITGETSEAWDRAIKAWRYAELPVEELLGLASRGEVLSAFYVEATCLELGPDDSLKAAFQELINRAFFSSNRLERFLRKANAFIAKMTRWEINGR